MADDIFVLSEDWGKVTEDSPIAVFGMGRIGRRVISTLVDRFTICFLIDENRSGETECGIEIVNSKEAVERQKRLHCKIIVTTMQFTYRKIAKVLADYGLTENEDFALFERFVEEWSLRWGKQCVLSKIDTVITSRCTLRCKNCNIFIGYAKENQDIKLDRLANNFDVFFDSVDYVYEYTLLGGEPFLHNNITEIITYLGETYGGRIGRINLISNGSVTPDEKTLVEMKRCDVSVHISDYTNVVDYKEKLRKTIDALSKNGVEYYIIKNNEWKDVVYPNEGFLAKDPHKHMQLCGHSTHSVDDGKLYWCDPAFAAECFMEFPSNDDDYLDLEVNKKKHSKYQASVNIMKYLLGNVNDKGYMSLCKNCAGVGEDNYATVQAGLQMRGDCFGI